jgi:PAS domain S-box-containing protein
MKEDKTLTDNTAELERMKAYMELAPDGIVALDLQGRFTFVNPAAERLSGYTERKLMGKRFQELLSPECVPAYLDLFQEALKGKETPAIQIEMTTEEGGRKLLELLGRPVKKGGKVVEIVGVARSIAERKHAEEALHESEAQTRKQLDEQSTLLAAIGAISSTLDLPSVLTRIAEQMCLSTDSTSAYIASFAPETNMSTMLAEYMGSEACPEESVSDLGETYEETDAGFMASLQANQPHIDHVEDPDLPEKDRAIMLEYGAQSILYIPLWIREELIGYAEVWESRERREFTPEEIAMCQGIAQSAAIALQNARLYEAAQQELAERKRVEEALRESRKRFRMLVEESPLGVSIVGKDGRYGYVNPKFVEMLGYTLEDIPTGREWFAKAYPDEEYREQAVSAWLTDLKELDRGEARPRTFTVTCKDGSEKVIQFRAVTMEAGDQFVTYEDITEQKRAEEALREARDELEVRVKERTADLETASEEMGILAEISRELNSTLDFERVINLVLDRAVEVTASTAGIIGTLTPEKDGLVLLAGRGVPSDVIEQYRSHPWKIEEGIVGRVATTGQSALVPDVREDPDYADVASGTLSELTVPILREGDIIGIINLESTELSAFAESDLAFVENLAEHAGIAIENARLYEESRRRADEMASVFQVSLIASSTLDMDELLSQTVAEMAELFQAEMAALLLYSEASRELAAHPSACFGLTRDQVQRFRISADVEDFENTLFKRGRPFFTNDAVNDPIIIGSYKPFVEPLGVTKLIGAPLRIHDRSIGEVYLMNRKAGPFTRGDMRLLFTLGTTIASAIENARLFGLTDERLREKVAELTVLQRIGQEISGTLDMDQILPRVLAEAVNATAATHGDLHLYDAMTQSLQLKAVYGYRPQEAQVLEETEIGLEKSIAGRVVREGQVALVPDVREDPDYCEVLRQTKSELAVPILYGRDVVGVINLESSEVAAFNEGDVEFLEALAIQAAVAIGSAIRYQAQVLRGDILRQRAEQLSDLSKITNAFRTDQPLEDLLEEIVLSIRDTVGFNIVLLSLVEADPAHLRRVVQAGIPLTLFEEIQKVRQPLEVIENIMRPEFRISQSYFFPHQRQEEWQVGLDIHSLTESREEVGEGEWHPDDMLLIPLRSREGETLGILSVDDPQDGQIPSEATVEIIELFAAQAAIAVENARLYEQTQRRAIQLGAVGEISRSVSSILDPNELVSQVVELIKDRLGYYQAHIFFVDPDSGYAIYGAGAGEEGRKIAEQGLRLKIGEEGIIGWVAAKGEPLLANDVSQDPRYVANEFLPHTKAELAVPLKVGEELVGVLDVQSDQLGAFGADDLFVLRSVAGQIAIAVQNARFFDEIREFSSELERRVEKRTEELARANLELTMERDRVEALYRITRDLGVSLDLDRVLTRALDLVTEALGAPQGSMMLLDVREGHLVTRAAKGESKPLPKEGEVTPFKRGIGLAGWIMEKREPVIIGDVSKDKRWLRLPDQKLMVKSVLGAPLMAGEDVLGVLMLSHPETNYFVPQHLRTVTAAASQVGAAINNAELYRLITHQAETVSDMLREQWAESSKTEAILESIVDGVVVFDDHNGVISINPAAERMLELSEEKVMGRTLVDLVEQGDVTEAEGISAIHSALLESRESFSRNAIPDPLRVEIGDRTISIAFSPAFLEERENVVGALRDISEEAEIDRMKSEFISVVSHELRTPMTSIKGYTDLLLMKTVGDINEKQERFLGVVKNNVDRLGALVSDLLDISRIESGRVKLEMVPLHMEEVISHAVSSLEEQIRERQHILTLNIPDDLPPVRGDQDRVTQVVTNLMANACMYTAPGGEIAVTVSSVDKSLRVDVSDNGIGISEEDCDRIFDRFYRADQPLVHDNPGTGLGLSIVKMFVEMHGGRVWVESQPGEGSTFTFTLPLMEAEEETGG